MAREIRITVIGGEQNGETFSAPLDGSVTIGRSRRADIPLKDRSEHLSREHFEIRREDGQTILFNNSKNETLVNSIVLPFSTSCPITVGMEVSVRKSVRFRFDSVGADDESDVEPATGGTLATRGTAGATATRATSATMASETLGTPATHTVSETRGTLATRAVTETRGTLAATATRGTRAVSETPAATVVHAARVVDAGLFAPPPTPPEPAPAGNESARDEASVTPVPPKAEDAPTPDLNPPPASRGAAPVRVLSVDDDAATGNVTPDETQAMSIDRTRAMSAGAWPTGSGTHSSGAAADPDSTDNDPERTRAMDGKTTGGSGGDSSTETKGADFERLRREEMKRKQKEFYRRVFLGVVMGGFLALLGGVIWYRWPRPEPFLTENDYAHQTITDKDGAKAFVAFYPRDRRMKDTVLPNGGLEVSTFLGRDRDVSFWMRVTRRDDPAELDLSLEESVARLQREMERKDQVSFLATPEWYDNGFCFLETEYPHFGRGPWRGTRLFRTEYRVHRGGEERHGVLFVVRNRTTAWRIERDIPEREWERGKILLRVNPNVDFYPNYLENRWESPGRSVMLTDASEERLLAVATAALERHELRPSEWDDLAKVLDTLVCRTVAGPADRRGRALKLLARFRAAKDLALKNCRTDYLKQQKGRSREGLSQASEAARAMFGANPKERYCDLVGDLEVWTCQRKN